MVVEPEQSDGTLYTVAYTKSEVNYGTTELKALALIKEVWYFRPYLLEHHCQAYTDYAA